MHVTFFSTVHSAASRTPDLPVPLSDVHVMASEKGRSCVTETKQRALQLIFPLQLENIRLLDRSHWELQPSSPLAFCNLLIKHLCLGFCSGLKQGLTRKYFVKG